MASLIVARSQPFFTSFPAMLNGSGAPNQKFYRPSLSSLPNNLSTKLLQEEDPETLNHQPRASRRQSIGFPTSHKNHDTDAPVVSFEANNHALHNPLSISSQNTAEEVNEVPACDCHFEFLEERQPETGYPGPWAFDVRSGCISEEMEPLDYGDCAYPSAIPT